MVVIFNTSAFYHCSDKNKLLFLSFCYDLERLRSVYGVKLLINTDQINNFLLLLYCSGSLPKLEFLSSMSSDSSKREAIIRDSHTELTKLQHKLSSLSAIKRLLNSAEKG